MHTLASAHAVVPHGVRLHYLDIGPRRGPAVVLLHGLSDSSFSFSRILPSMPPDMRILVPDLRGHGESERVDGGYTIDDFADDVLGLLNVLGIHRARFVGHSMGSFVARRIAERAPARVDELMLIAAALTARHAPVFELEAAVATVTDPLDPAFLREFQLSTCHRPLPDDFLARVIAESAKVPAHVWRAAVAGLLAFDPQWPIACPTRIVGGDRDAIFSAASQKALTRSIARATLHLETDVGHALHWEMPERFVRLAFSEEALTV